MGKHKIDNMVLHYRDTKDKTTLDKIAIDTQALAYSIGKSFKGVKTCDINSLFGIALMKAIRNWKEDKQTKFTTYLTMVITNELRMHIRGKQHEFECGILQQVDYFDNIVSNEDVLSNAEYKTIVDRAIDNFESEKTRQALKMYYDGYLIEHIVRELGLGRSSFYEDLKVFKQEIREGLLNDNEV